MLSHRRRVAASRIVVPSAALAVALSGMALAQTMPDRHPITPATPQIVRPHHPPGPMGTHEGMQPGTAAPAMPGQDAFGAVQEIVHILEADPKTDWSRVNLEALRQHLIDMNEVTLRADAAVEDIDGGLTIAVTGSGRTRAATQRMIPAHAVAIDGRKGWSARVAPTPDGVRLTVTASDPNEVRHIRGLGFIGLMVSGGHHQPHHLSMVRGEFSDTN